MTFMFEAISPMNLQEYSNEEIDLINEVIHELNAKLKKITLENPSWQETNIEINRDLPGKIGRTIGLIFRQKGWNGCIYERKIKAGKDTMIYHIQNPLSSNHSNTK